MLVRLAQAPFVATVNDGTSDEASAPTGARMQAHLVSLAHQAQAELVARGLVVGQESRESVRLSRWPQLNSSSNCASSSAIVNIGKCPVAISTMRQPAWLRTRRRAASIVG